jgi:UDP-galactopyranose mutase
MQPYERLPEIMGGFDVALMPFALNDATRSISPTKTLEYLAADLPVVSTRVPDVVADFGAVVDLQDDAAGFAGRLRARPVRRRGASREGPPASAAAPLGHHRRADAGPHGPPRRTTPPPPTPGPSRELRSTMSTPNVLIVGGGLTACTLAHRPRPGGRRLTVLERLDVPGGLIRSERMGGVLYEPHGSHIFHTEDEEVWELANAMTPFNAYRHRVDIVATASSSTGRSCCRTSTASPRPRRSTASSPSARASTRRPARRRRTSRSGAWS